MENPSEKSLPFNDAIMMAKLDEIKKFPEMIQEITEWRSVSLCFFCLNEIPNNHGVLRNWRMKELSEIGLCPHCKKPPVAKKIVKVSDDYKKGYRWKVSALRHYIVRKRDIITGYKKDGWFSKKPIFFTETQLIFDVTK